MSVTLRLANPDGTRQRTVMVVGSCRAHVHADVSTPLSRLSPTTIGRVRCPPCDIGASLENELGGRGVHERTAISRPYRNRWNSVAKRRLTRKSRKGLLATRHIAPKSEMLGARYCVRVWRNRSMARGGNHKGYGHVRERERKHSIQSRSSLGSTIKLPPRTILPFGPPRKT